MAREAIFIGYRRDDTADVAGRIYDALAARFGEERVFKDVDNIPVGADFGEYIKGILPRCSVALILIGRNWIDSADASGKRRLDDEHDWVRLEVETALRLGDIQVVPVLVNGAEMPHADALPPPMRALVRRNAAVIRRDPDFRADIDRLANALRQSVRTGFLDLDSLKGEHRQSPVRVRQGAGGMLIAGSILATVLIGLGLIASRWLTPVQSDVEAQTSETTDTPTSDTLASSSAQQVSSPPIAQRDAAEQVSPPQTTPQLTADSDNVHGALMALDAVAVEAALRQDWNPNAAIDVENNAALHKILDVCERRHDQEALVRIVRLLIDAGADKSATNIYGDTPLRIASVPHRCGPDHPVIDLLR